METITLYLPIVLPSLTGILVLLIGHLLGFSAMGLIAGLVTVSSNIFLVRTRAGYFDTDLLTLIIPLALIYLLLRIVKTNDFKNALVASLLLTTQTFFYNNAPLLSEIIIITFIGFTALLRRDNASHLGSILILLPAMVSFDLPTSIRIALIVGAYFIVTQHQTEKGKLQKWTLLGIVAVLPLSNLGERGWDKVSYFFNTADTTSSTGNLSFSYTSITSTVDEIKKINWDRMIELASNSELTFYLSIIGLVLFLLFRFQSILIWGLLALGATSLFTGERFTIFMIAPLSIGFAFLLQLIASNLSNININGTTIKRSTVQYLALAVLALPILYQNTSYAINYSAPPILFNDEAVVLNAVGEITQPHDKIIAWWDYGYEIHYFSGRQTIASGSATPQQLFTLSAILSNPDSQLVANFAHLLSESGTDGIEKRMKGNLKTGKLIFTGLSSTDAELPEKTHAKYIYLPARMIDIFPTIYSMSNKNLLTGEKFPYTLYIGKNAQKTGSKWTIDNSIEIDLKSGMMKSPQGNIKIAQYIEVDPSNGDKPKTHVTLYKDAESNISLVFFKGYNKIMLLDENALNSAYIKMFFFEEFDPNLFELRIRNNHAKLYRVK
jgi:dolichyl-diphosphooligosaccharide--protein glycosyltransferase/undecaprenyl-diphosphooligosaccharide--protein glycosyltransferase